MNNSRLNKSPIYINCILYLIVSIMLTQNIWETIESNAILTNQNIIIILLFSALIFFLIVISYGLLALKKWARVMAISWNLSIAFLLVGLKVVIYIISDPDLNISGYFNFYSLMQIAIGLTLIYLSIIYTSNSIKDKFK